MKKKTFKLKPQALSENDEQALLFDWARAMEPRHPALALLYAVPNGIPIYGPQRFAIINAFKRRGLKTGVPDIVLPVRRDPYAGLYIELKREKGGKRSVEQEAWIDALRGQGYRAEFCNGFKQAVEVIIQYLLGQQSPAVHHSEI